MTRATQAVPPGARSGRVSNRVRRPRSHSAAALCRPLGCRGLAAYRKTAFTFFSVSHGSGSIRPMSHVQRTSVWPNNSFNPRPATASLVRPGCASCTIVAARPYKARLRGRG